MFSQRPLGRMAAWAFLFCLATGGCSETEQDEARARGFDFAGLVPVTGTVVCDGKPLENAVVTFLPERGLPGVGETNAAGKFTLATQNHPGVSPGGYRVAVSYFVSAEGVPQGLGPRSSLVQPPGMLSAKEFVPSEYSDLSRTKLRATVDPTGGSFDFELPPLINVPKKSEPAPIPKSTPSAEAKTP